MAECLEAIVAVCVTYTGVVDATEGQVTVKELHQCVIHAGTTRNCLAENLVDICVFVAIDVER